MNDFKYSDLTSAAICESKYHPKKKQKSLGSHANARVSAKFNRKCIKLKCKEMLFSKKISPILSMSRKNVTKYETIDECDENTGSPLTQLANAFGGICTFGTPTSSKIDWKGNRGEYKSFIMLTYEEC